MNAFMLFAKKYRVEYTQMYPGKDNRYVTLHEIQCTQSHRRTPVFVSTAGSHLWQTFFFYIYIFLYILIDLIFMKKQ